MPTNTQNDTPAGQSPVLALAHGSADFSVGGGWGNAINWTRPADFGKPITEKSRFSVVGWKDKKPEVGDTLKGEFEKSWMYFEFTEVRPCGDPADMFFGTVKPIRQEMKSALPNVRDLQRAGTEESNA